MAYIPFFLSWLAEFNRKSIKWKLINRNNIYMDDLPRDNPLNYDREAQ